MQTRPFEPCRANPTGDLPQTDTTAYIDATAQIIGNARIGARVFIGPNAVLRADEPDANGTVHPLVIESESNVQDGVIVHALAGTTVTVGSRTSLSHGAVVHGPCAVGAGCFLGFRSVVFNATLGDEVYVGAGAIVQDVVLEAGTWVPAGGVIVSAEQTAQLGTIGVEERRFMERVSEMNVQLSQAYLNAAQ